MTSLKEELLFSLKNLFNLNLSEWRDIDRPFQYPIVTAILTSSEGKIYFLKESKEYTPASELDQIYSSLESLRTLNPRLVCLPLRWKVDRYVFSIAEKNFNLFEYLDLRDLGKNDVSFKSLRIRINELHSALDGKALPTNDISQYRSLQTWLERPITYLPERYGQNLPYVQRFESFILSKFKNITFRRGNVHWDISPENVCIDSNNNLFFIDLELLHHGPLFFDYLRAASIYLEYDKKKISLDNEIFEELKTISSNLTTGMDDESLRLLLSRCVVRNIRGGLMPTVRTEVPDFLRALENFTLLHS